MAMEAQPVRVGQTACAHVCSPDHCRGFPPLEGSSHHTRQKSLGCYLVRVSSMEFGAALDTIDRFG